MVQPVTENIFMKSKLKNQGGFTLIELMLVVAIISIMSAIAIPNLISYVAKSRQAEAQMNLGGVYTDEMAYFSGNDTYSDSFNNIGFGLAGGSKYYDYTITAPGDWGSTSWIGLHGSPGAGPPIGTVLNLNALPGASVASFTCIAAGNIDNDPEYDVWSIGQNGSLNNDYSDILH
jgi:type IV pilus assembly protein PilA